MCSNPIAIIYCLISELNNTINWGNIKLDRIGKGEKENSIKFVGITIDEDLSFSNHGKYVASKIRQNSYLISANKNFLPYTTRLLLYNTLIRPYLEYGANIWGPFNVSLISKMQKAIIRHVVNTKNFISHTNDYFIQLKTPKFRELILFNHTRLCHKVVHFSQPTAVADIFKLTKSTRRQRDLIIPSHRHCSHNDSKLPPISAPKVWNNLPNTIKDAQTQITMKSRLMTHIINLYKQTPPCKKQECKSCQQCRPIFSNCQ